MNARSVSLASYTSSTLTLAQGSRLKFFAPCHIHPHAIHGSLSLARPTPLSTSQPSSCLSSSSPSSTSATSSSRSSTRRSWKTCATPPTTGGEGSYDVLYLPTGYEPNGHDFNELQNSSVPLSFKIPAADQDVDDLTLGEMLTEAHRGQVDCVPGGMSVSQSSSSVMFDGSGQPDGERKVDQSGDGGITKIPQQFSTFDTIARRKLIEDQNTIMELSGRL